nr:type II toxin-antitoxin system Phd/YefM family antitoxin [Pseudomonas hunanensis]
MRAVRCARQTDRRQVGEYALPYARWQRPLGRKLVPTIISLSQARRRFRRLAALVIKGHSFIITRHGKPYLLMDAPEHWNTPEPGNSTEREHLYSTAKKPTKCTTHSCD